MLGATIFALLALHVFCVLFLRITLGHDFVYGLVSAFDLDAEASVPTWFSFVLILSASVASLLAGINDRQQAGELKNYWFVLSAALCFVSIDEQAQLHEGLGTVIKARDIFFYSWVLVYGPAAFLLGLFLLRFLLRLPRSTAIAFVSAGAIYVAGAVGLELVESRIADAQVHGSWSSATAREDRALKNNVPYQVAVAFEETLEMVGMSVYLVSVLGYLGLQGVNFEISFVRTSDAQAAEQRSTSRLSG